MSKEKLLVTVSGGRTSGYMAIKLFNEYKDQYDMTFVYCNTGQEHDKTLEFVHNIETKFNIPIIWLEAVVHHGKKKGSTYKKVNFETASRNGEPFEEVVKKYGLPTHGYMHCTRELKINPIKTLKKELGIKVTALGIRADEMRRYKPNKESLYPLIDMFETKKPEILKWWSKQEFDLEIPDYLGNCTWCYKKSDKKLDIIAKENPSIFNFPLMLEQKYADGKQIFRGFRTTQDVLNRNKVDVDNLDECADECGTVII